MNTNIATINPLIRGFSETKDQIFDDLGFFSLAVKSMDLFLNSIFESLSSTLSYPSTLPPSVAVILTPFIMNLPMTLFFYIKIQDKRERKTKSY